MNSGLVIIRLVLGLVMAAHGAQKLFGWFGGPGLSGAAAGFEAMGFRPGRFFATLASLTETASGLLVAAGFLGPIGPALMVSVMIVAGSVHWPQGLFAQKNGYEVPLLYAAGAATLALTGFGRYSVDALLGIGSLWTPAFAVLALAVGVAGGFGNVALRRSEPAAQL